MLLTTVNKKWFEILKVGGLGICLGFSFANAQSCSVAR